MIKRGMNKNLKILIIVVVVLAILVAGYFGYKTYDNTRGKKIFQEGAQYGYAKAIMDIINISDTCNTFPVYVGNVSRELVSVTCYKDQL